MNNKKLKKIRIDKILLDRGIAESRSKAQAMIMAHQVFSNKKLIRKSGELFIEDAKIQIVNKNNNWVSRGAEKIEPIIFDLGIKIYGKKCLDIGSSTGGFTEVLLKYGANKVYAVDVGYGQLHERIKSNKKVISLERTNARYLNSKIIKEQIHLITCDASFISLRKIINKPLELLKKNGIVIALIKPQFEVMKKNLKGGVVKNPELHKQVCDEIKKWFEKEKKMVVINIVESPLRGPKGNIEFFIIAVK